MTIETSSSSPFYRVDKFVVPTAGREEFLARVAQTHAVLRAQEGFVRDLILEQASGPGVFNFVTLVEWTSQGVIERVSAAVAQMHRGTGFDRQAFIARLGITADIANYREVLV